jgi:hypothetical protein
LSDENPTAENVPLTVNSGTFTEPEVIVPQHPNLRPWRKGQTGNPKGRPKTKPLSDALKRQLAKKVPVDTLATIVLKAPGIAAVIGRRPTYADLLAFSLIQQGIQGNIAAAGRIFDRVEGKIPKEIMAGDDGKLDEILEALAAGPMPVGSVNEGVDDDPGIDEVLERGS